MSNPKHPVVFLFDVDNTLLDNDRVVQDLGDHLQQVFGADTRKRYFDIFEDLRKELGYADYLGALQRYRVEHPRDVRLLEMSSFLIDYPFDKRLYPGALDAIKRCRTWGPVAILSDGDVVFQPRKVLRAGIHDAVSGQVLIYIHKEEVLDDVENRFPAEHYVLVDDKPRIDAAVKKYWKDRVTTILPRQGHYALGPDAANYPPADITIESIGELTGLELSRILEEAK
jgi:FMN phosphatase YigB (HAD superfamily)